MSFLRIHFTFIFSYSLLVCFSSTWDTRFSRTPISPGNPILNFSSTRRISLLLVYLAALLELMLSAWPWSCSISFTHWSQLSCSHDPPISAFFCLCFSHFRKTSSTSLLAHTPNFSSQRALSFSWWHQTHLPPPCFHLNSEIKSQVWLASQTSIWQVF